MTNNPFLLELKLKQHTPIIHFQSDQEGATLRATEVKPKLDRFLIEHHFGGYQKFDEYSSFLIGKTQKDIDQIKSEIDKLPNDGEKINYLKKQKLALDYKISIWSPSSEKWMIFSNLATKKKKNGTVIRNNKNYILQHTDCTKILFKSPFFANNQYFDKRDEPKFEWEKMKYGLYSNDLINMKFKFSSTILKKHIKQNIEDFFIKENFGCRQNKGFGSFTIQEINKELININKNYFEKKLKKYNYIVLKLTRYGKNIQEIFKEIVNIYQNIKSIPGQNDSFLKEFVSESTIDSKNITWEKVAIKRQMYNNSRTKYMNAKENERYVRVLLGMAGHYEYQQKDIPINKINIKEESGQIERFKSPITFKVFKGHIYITGNSVAKQIFDKMFLFEAEPKRPILKIKSPPNDVFDLPSFLADFANEYQDSVTNISEEDYES